MLLTVACSIRFENILNMFLSRFCASTQRLANVRTNRIESVFLQPMLEIDHLWFGIHRLMTMNEHTDIKFVN